MVPQLLEAQLIRVDNHAIGGMGSASELRFRNPFNLNNAEPASPVGLKLCQRLQARVIAERRYIDTSLLSSLEYSRSLIHPHLPGINGKSDFFHIAPR